MSRQEIQGMLAVVDEKLNAWTPSTYRQLKREQMELQHALFYASDRTDENKPFGLVETVMNWFN